MRITDIQTLRVKVPNDTWDIIRILTDEGIYGWGEVSSSLDIDGVSSSIDEIKQIIVGHSPSEVESLTYKMESWMYPSKKDMRCYRCAISGINQALWDLFAKEMGIPLYQLYGSSEKSIPLYANLNKALRNNRSSSQMGSNAEKAMKEGFSFVKCTPFDEIQPNSDRIDFRESFKRLGAVVEAASIENTAIDCHQRFNRYSLARMIEKIEKEYGIPYWIEDTVDILDYGAQRTIVNRYPEIRFAAGEDSVNPSQIIRTINSDCYDVIMPDVKYIGGPSSVKSISGYAEIQGKMVSLHNPNGLISTAHSAHLSALLRTRMPMEFPYMATPERKEMASPTETIIDGVYVFNDAPGIGVELKEDVLIDSAEVFEKGKWNKYPRRDV